MIDYYVFIPFHFVEYIGRMMSFYSFRRTKRHERDKSDIVWPSKVGRDSSALAYALANRTHLLGLDQNTTC